MAVDITERDARALTIDGQLTRYVPLSGERRLYPLAAAFGGDTNPDAIPIATYAQMRDYATIRAALILIATPILAQMQQATVESDDPAVREFVQATYLDTGLAHAVTRQCLHALAFGFSANEIIWQVEDLFLTATEADEDGIETEIDAWSGPAITIKGVVEVNPATVTEIIRRRTTRDGKPADGSYDGFVQSSGSGERYDDPNGGGSKSGIYVPAVKSLWYTHDMEFGNYWGVPRTRAAYPYWSWAQQAWKLWMAWSERKIGPNRIVRYPVGVTEVEGVSYDNATLALMAVNQMDAVNAIALPSTYDENGNPKWAIESQPVDGDSTPFQELVDTLDGRMLRGMFTPERTFLEGQYGTKAESETQTDTFMGTLEAEQANLVYYQNRYLIDRLVSVNFGPDAKAAISVPGLTSDEETFLRGVFDQLVANPENGAQIAFRALAERYGIPLNEEQPVEEDPLAPVDAEGEPLDTETPENLILGDEDADVVMLATDPSRFTVTPDPSSKLGYKVVDRRTGARLTGNAAAQVIKSVQGAGAAAQKKAESERKKAEKAAAAAAKKAQRAAEVAARKQTRAAEAAAKKAQREAEAAQRKADAAAKKEQRDAERAQKKAESEAKKLNTEQVRAAKSEKDEIEKATARLSDRLAAEAVRDAGWDTDGASDADRDAAIERATELAREDPDSVVSVVQTKNGFMVVKKPKSKIATKAAGPANVELAEGDEDEGHDSSAPTPEARAVWAVAEERIAAIMGAKA